MPQKQVIHHLFWCYSAYNRSFGIPTKGRLKYAGQFTIAIRYVAPVLEVAFQLKKVVV